jgi:curved DNA-binding protein CbpA
VSVAQLTPNCRVLLPCADRKGGSTRAFQRIAAAFQTLSDPIKRSDYDRGGDVRARKAAAGNESDEEEEEEEEEEHRKTLREEIERKYYPERYEFLPFGDPFIHKRKRQEQQRRQQGRPAWYEEDEYGM